MPADLTGYRNVWLFAMFDLPVTTRAARRRYAQFRRLLLEEGFTMLQFSVYARHCASEESSEVIRDTIRAGLPADGQVRLLAVTDRQFGKMEVFYGKKRTPVEDPPAQIMLF
jgi:CRISPR-associated protein Cas2